MRPSLLRAADSSQLLFMAGRLTRADARIIQLISAMPREGVSTLAGDLAIFAASNAGHPVLLLDLGLPTGHQLDRFAKMGAARAPGQGEPAPLPHELGGGAIEIATIPGTQLRISRRLAPTEVSDIPQVTGERFADWLRSRFEWVIVDAPSIARNFDGIVTAGFADAVLIVVAAETTRAPVVDHLRDRLVDAQANIAGVIMNRRKFYIPRFLYRRL
jgi:Mrp family chromosome partitioning ATPase